MPKSALLFCFLWWAAFLSIRFLHQPLNSPPVLPADSGAFLETAKSGILSKPMWMGVRPPVVPLVYKLFISSHDGIVAFQTFFSMISWSVLALACSSCFSSARGRVISFVWIWAFSCMPRVARWDSILISESISNSLQILALSAVLIFRQNFYVINRLAWAAAAVLVTTTAAVFARDTNAYNNLVIYLSLGLAACQLNKRSVTFRVTLMVFALLAVVHLMQSKLMGASARWHFPLTNNLLQRVLPHPDKARFFVEQGMPQSEAINQLKGKWASSEGWAAMKNAQFQSWLQNNGLKAYKRFLMFHPRYTAVSVLYASDTLMKIDPADLLRGDNQKAAWIETLQAFLIPSGSFVILSGALLIIAAYRAGGERITLEMLLIFYSCAWVQLILGFHGDAMEVERHVLQATIFFRLTFFLGVAAVLQHLEFVENWPTMRQFKEMPQAVDAQGQKCADLSK